MKIKQENSELSFSYAIDKCIEATANRLFIDIEVFQRVQVLYGTFYRLTRHSLDGDAVPSLSNTLKIDGERTRLTGRREGGTDCEFQTDQL